MNNAAINIGILIFLWTYVISYMLIKLMNMLAENKLITDE